MNSTLPILSGYQTIVREEEGFKRKMIESGEKRFDQFLNNAITEKNNNIQNDRDEQVNVQSSIHPRNKKENLSEEDPAGENSELSLNRKNKREKTESSGNEDAHCKVPGNNPVSQADSEKSKINSDKQDKLNRLLATKEFKTIKNITETVMIPLANRTGKYAESGIKRHISSESPKNMQKSFSLSMSKTGISKGKISGSITDKPSLSVSGKNNNEKISPEFANNKNIKSALQELSTGEKSEYKTGSLKFKSMDNPEKEKTKEILNSERLHTSSQSEMPNKIVNSASQNKPQFTPEILTKSLIQEFKTMIPLTSLQASRISDMAKFGKMGNNYFVTMQLYPEELGRVDVYLKKSSHGLKGKIFVESNAIGSLLHNRVDSIVSRLVDKGINVEQFEVIIQNNLNNSHNNSHFTPNNENKMDNINTIKGNNNLDDLNENIFEKSDFGNPILTDFYTGKKINVRI